MTEIRITPFLFEGEVTVRVVYRNDEPWFVTIDVCRALGIANASQAVGSLDDDEKGICSIYTLRGEQEMLIVSEGGLFTLILRCRDAMKEGTLPHRFRRWVTGEVLPSLRAQGQIRVGVPSILIYSAPEAVKVRLSYRSPPNFRDPCCGGAVVLAWAADRRVHAFGISSD